MQLIRRILFLAIIAVIAVFIFQNQENLGQPLGFQFLHWSSDLVLGFWILFAFLAGAVLFVLIDAWKSMLLRRGIDQRDRRIALLERELADATTDVENAPFQSAPETPKQPE